MAFGLTPQGLVIKRLSDIQDEVRSSLRAALGNNINLLPQAVLGQLTGIFSEREALVWEVVEDVYNSAYPDTAEGASLDNVLALTGIKRLPATYSHGTARLFGTAGTFVPKNSVISVDGTPASKFNTNADATIQPAVNAVQTLVFSAIPDSGSYKIKIGLLSTATINYNDNAAAIQAKINALTGYSGVTVTGTLGTAIVVTFAGGSGAQVQPLIVITNNTLLIVATSVTVSVLDTTDGHPAQVDVGVTCQVTGPVIAPADSLTVIESPVAGWSSVTNVDDVIVGSNIETDTEARIRRLNLLGGFGSATLQAIVAAVAKVTGVTQVLGFENLNMTVDGFGRPAKSFEVVVQGGDDQTIADEIYGEKPAGILSYGTTTKQVVDAYDFSHDISFSRPILVPIYVTLNISKNAKFPINGADIVKQDVVARGNSLNIGQSVIVFGTNGLSCAIDQVPGILDYDIFVGTAPNPLSNDNLPINPTSLAVFDTARVTVTFV